MYRKMVTQFSFILIRLIPVTLVIFVCWVALRCRRLPSLVLKEVHSLILLYYKYENVSRLPVNLRSHPASHISSSFNFVALNFTALYAYLKEPISLNAIFYKHERVEKELPY